MKNSKYFKKILKLWCTRHLRQQPGQILIYALLVMVVGSLLITGTFSFVQSGLKQGTISEDRTARVYAADAGVESAWQRIATGDAALPATVADDPVTYASMDLGGGLSTTVTVDLIEEILTLTAKTKTYQITSVSTSTSGKTTQIDSKLTAISGPYCYFLDNSFTTEKNIDFKSKITVNGDIQCGTHTGKIPIWLNGHNWVGGTPTVWPTSTDLLNYYGLKVTQGLAVLHSGGWSPSTATVDLAASQYVDGDFSYSNGALNLHGYTLFVNGNVEIKHCAVNLPLNAGSGCIVATGNITFWPDGDTGDSTRGIFIFSVGSTGAEFLPGQNFYGWIAAQNGIEVKSGTNPSYNWVFPPTLNGSVTLDFPGLNTAGGPNSLPFSVQVTSWDVN